MGLTSIFGGSAKRKSRGREQAVLASAAKRAEALRIKRAKENEERQSVAFRLAQFATSAGGLFSEAKTSRKKLLGN